MAGPSKGLWHPIDGDVLTIKAARRSPSGSSPPPTPPRPSRPRSRGPPLPATTEGTAVGAREMTRSEILGLLRQFQVEAAALLGAQADRIEALDREVAALRDEVRRRPAPPDGVPAPLRIDPPPRTPAEAAHLGSLTWLYISVCVVVYILVIAALIFAFARAHHGVAMEPGSKPISNPELETEARAWRWVGSCIVLTVFTLFVLLIADFVTGRSVHALAETPDPLTIKVIGHQWWWEVSYLEWPARFGEAYPSNGFSTANEIHIPVDPQHPVVVKFELESHDVIHSFWVPNLHGKRDVVPGHPTDIWIRADQPGTYYGECAEYCGYQHANMRLIVIAEPVEQFQKWLDRQRSVALDPTEAQEKRGHDVFVGYGSACIMCHTIQGTPARGRVGPDLTHVASRQLLAGGAITNSPGNLAGWVVDPQTIKPGCRMPQNNLTPDDLRACSHIWKL